MGSVLTPHHPEPTKTAKPTTPRKQSRQNNSTTVPRWSPPCWRPSRATTAQRRASRAGCWPTPARTRWGGEGGREGACGAAFPGPLPPRRPRGSACGTAQAPPLTATFGPRLAKLSPRSASVKPPVGRRGFPGGFRFVYDLAIKCLSVSRRPPMISPGRTCSPKSTAPSACPPRSAPAAAASTSAMSCCCGRWGCSRRARCRWGAGSCAA